MAELTKEGRKISHPDFPDISPLGKSISNVAQAVQKGFSAYAEHDKAMRGLDASYLYSETSNLLNEMYIDALHPTNIANVEGGNAMQRYLMQGASFVDKALQEAPMGFQDELKLKLNSVLNGHTLKLREKLQSHFVEKSKNNIEAMIDESLLNMTNAIKSGDMLTAKQARGEVLDLLDKGQAANFFTGKETQTARLKLNQVAISAEYGRLGEEAAVVSPDEAARVQKDLALNEAGLLPHELEEARKSAQHAISETESLLSRTRKNEIENLEAELAKLELQHEQFRVGGLQERANKIEADMRDIVQKLEGLNAISGKESFNAQVGIRNTGISQRYFERGRRDARAQAGTVEQQTEEFSQGIFPEDLTEAQKVNAIQSYVKGASHVESLSQQQKALNYADTIRDIDNGLIETPADILGRNLTALQGKQAEAHLRKNLDKQNTEQQNLTGALKAIQAGGGAQDRLTKDQKDGAFNLMAQTLQNFRIKETGDSNYQLNHQDLTQVLRQINTDVPWFNAKMEYALLRADGHTETDGILDALAFGRELAKHPNTLKGIDAKARSVMNMTNAVLLSARNPNINNIIEKARAAANPDDPTKIAYAQRWNSLSEKDKNKLYKGIFDDNPQNNIETYGQFKNLLELYNGSSDTLDAALESVRQEMTPVYGKDRFFEQGKNGYLPSNTAVPFSEIGQWYHNQIYLDLYALTKRQRESGYEASERIEWVYDNVPDKFPEEKLMNENLHLLSEQGKSFQKLQGAGATTLKAKVKGELVDIFYKADGFSRIGENERVKYVFYYKNKEGETFYIKDPKSKDGSGVWVEYPLSLPDFLPTEYGKFDDENFDDVIIESYKQERLKKNEYFKWLTNPPERFGKEQKEKRMQELRETLKSQKSQIPELKTKKSTPDIVAKILEGE